MEKIKFFQIVIPDNPVSMKYAEISRKSYEPVSDLIEIIPFEAITPYHEDFEEHVSLNLGGCLQDSSNFTANKSTLANA